MTKKFHTIHIRKLEHEIYMLMWNMKKDMKAHSWADMMRKICEKYREDIKEFEWL